jgi:O-acetyl-ADP-ribose deacetylase
VIELVLGDITEQEVDAIVNAANSTLLGGGGVDGAIHAAGGTTILEECRLLGGCEPGDVKATSGGALPAKHVLHAVGPIWRGGGDGEAELLASCHRRAVEISTGAYGYPVERAAPVAVAATKTALLASPSVELARFVFRDEATLAVYRKAVV